MWGIFGREAGENAKESIASALEKTGDVLTSFATDHVAKQRQEEQAEGGGGGGDKKPAGASAAAEDAEGESSASSGGTENTTDTTSTATSSQQNNVTESTSGGGGDATVVKSEGGGVDASEQTSGGNDGKPPQESSPRNAQPNRFAAFMSGAGAGLGGGIVGGAPGAGSGTATESGGGTTEGGGAAAAAAVGAGSPSGQQRKFGANFLAFSQKAIEQTRQAVQQTSTNLLVPMVGGANRRVSQKRDISLPLDTDALRDAEVVYVTDRLITLGHPALQSGTDGNLTPQRKLAAVAHLLEKRHAGRYMVWNLSEVEYDYSILDDQVLAYQFPGSPSPPLGLLLKLIFSMESWLKADSRNVAVLHCLTGKGRTSTVLSCFLCWTGEAGFHDPMKALEYISMCKRCAVDQLTIPSQRRYLSYFSNMLDGVRPQQPPLMLKRIIMSEAPRMEKAPAGKKSTADDNDKGPPMGCSPYLQIFKGGSLVFTTAASMSYSQEADDLPFCVPSDGSITFPVETVVQGDILIRCRHLTHRGKRVSMFRAAFHTGYTPPRVLRLTKEQLDGACADRRFQNDFFIDLVFEACDAEEASRHLLPSLSSMKLEGAGRGGGGGDGDDNGDKSTEVVQNQAAQRRSMGTMKDGPTGGAVAAASVAGKSNNNPQAAVAASTYDSMLHRDARFWDVISKRREVQQSKSSEVVDGEEVVSSGPTIGRRRDLSNLQKQRKNAPGGGGAGGGAGKGSSEGRRGSGSAAGEGGKKPGGNQPIMQSFSIGGGFDFDFADDDGEDNLEAQAAQQQQQQQQREESPKKPKEKDELMEALMAMDDDDDVDDGEDEIDFEAADDGGDEKDTGATEADEEKGDDDEAGEDDKSSPAEISTGGGDASVAAEGDKTDDDAESPSGNVDASAEGAAESSSPSQKTEKDTVADAPSPSPPVVTAQSSETESAGASADGTPDPVKESQEQDETVLASLEDELDEFSGVDDVGNDGDGGDDDFDFDDDDELEDLEKFLTSSGK